jgi:WD40 repeat protein
MSAQLPTTILQNPYVGLRPFDRADAHKFFGRLEQTHALLQVLRGQPPDITIRTATQTQLVAIDGSSSASSASDPDRRAADTHGRVGGPQLKFKKKPRFVAVTGSSGCGKSSLVRAGLIPALEGGFLVGDRDKWHIATLKPGLSPMYNLASALPRAGRSAEALAKDIEADLADAVVGHLSPMLAEGDQNLLIIVDQFEELFRFRQGSSEAATWEVGADFVSVLLTLAEDTTLPIYVVLTMRSDFIGDCDAYPGLPEAINSSLYLVPRLTEAQLREAIRGPARMEGATVANELVQRLLEESSRESDQLPVLQHALMRTWQKWQREGNLAQPIQEKHYLEAKGLSGALSDHADEALQGFSKTGADFAARVFKVLATTDAANRRIRRPARLSEIQKITGVETEEPIWDVVHRFSCDDRSFLVASFNEERNETLIDISHESLIRRWKTLRDWVDEEAESAKEYQRVADAAARHARRQSGLYDDPQLQLALDWKDNQRPNRAWAQRHCPDFDFDATMQFLERSRQARDERIERENKRREDELHRIQQLADAQKIELERTQELARTREELLANAQELAQVREKERERIQQLADAQKIELERTQELAQTRKELLANAHQVAGLRQQALQRFRWFAGIAAALAVFAIALAFDAWRQRSRAESAERFSEQIADAYSLMIPAKELVYTHPERSLLLAVEALTIFPSNQQSAKQLTVGAENVLRNALSVSNGIGFSGHEGDILSVGVNSNGTWLVTGSVDGSVRRWDLSATSPARPVGEILAQSTSKGAEVRTIAISPDDRWVVAGLENGTITVAPVAGVSNRESVSKPQALNAHQGFVSTIAMSGDSSDPRPFMISGGEDGAVLRWDLTSMPAMQAVPLQTGGEPVSLSQISADSQWLLVGTAFGTLTVWKTSGPEPRRIDWQPGPPTSSATISADSQWVILGGKDGVTRMWRLSSLENGASVPQATFIQSAASGSASKGRLAPAIVAVGITPDNRWLVTGSEDGVTRLWDLTRAGGAQGSRHVANESVLLAGVGEGRPTAMKLTADSRWLAAATEAGPVRLWDLSSVRKLNAGPPVSPLTASDTRGNADPRTSGDSYQSAADTRSPEPTLLRGHDGVVRDLVFTPDSHWLITAGVDRTARKWDLGSPDPSSLNVAHRGHRNPLSAVAISTDMTWQVTGSIDGRVEACPLAGPFTDLHSEAGCVTEASLESGALISRVKISSDNQWRASLAINGHLRLQKLQEPASGISWRNISAFDFSADGQWLVTSGTPMTLPSATQSRPVTQVWALNAARSRQEPLFTLEQTAAGQRVAIVSISSNKRFIVTAAEDGFARLWDLGQNPPVETLLKSDKGHWISAIAMSLDNKWLALGNRLTGAALVWDLSGQAPVERYRYTEQGNGINALAFTSDSRYLITGGENGTARTYDLIADRLLFTFGGHNGPIYALAVSHDNTRLMTGGKDGTVRVRDLSAGATEHLLMRGPDEDGPIVAGGFSADGKWLVSSSQAGTARWWHLDRELLIQDALRIAGRDLTDKEWEVYLPGQEYRRTYSALLGRSPAAAETSSGKNSSDGTRPR